MKPQFDCMAIVGVGLLGASLGLAVKARGIAGRVLGVGHRQCSLDSALACRAIDEAFLEVPPALETADCVVIATPAALVAEKLDVVRRAAPPHAVATDVASTKGLICAHAEATWPTPRRFIGSHPMAGSEKFGPEHGRPDFYEGAICLVEEGGTVDAAARAAIAGLWEAVGARVLPVEPLHHDGLLARTSHLPHVAAAAVAAIAANQGDVAPFVGKGFRDATRIAASRPEVWRDICLTNRDALLAGLGELDETLHHFADALARGDGGAVEAFFETGRSAREKAVPK